MELFDNQLVEKAKQMHGIAFMDKINDIASDLGVLNIWLLSIMNHESGMNPQAKNPNPPYPVGLIQFVPSTATYLGTTTEALYQMTAIQQLDYVYKYFLPYKNQLNSLTDVALVTFYPVAVDKEWDWVFPQSVIEANRGLFIHGTTKRAYSEYVCEKLARPYGIFCDSVPLIGSYEKKKVYLIAIMILILMGVGFYLLNSGKGMNAKILPI